MHKLNRLWIGLIAGLIGPFIGYVLFYCITSSHMTFDAFNRFIIHNGSTHSGILSVSLIFNLSFFFAALHKDWYYTARGVIFATLLYAPLVVFLKYG